jgi:alpha-1,6-mannosyltransferase
MPPTPTSARHRAQLQSAVRRCGVVNVVALGLFVPLSLTLAPVTPYGNRAPRMNVAFEALRNEIEQLSPTAGAVARRVLFDNPLQSWRATRVLAYTLLLVLSTGAFVTVLARLREHVTLIDEAIVATLVRVSVMGAVVSLFAYPMFTHDVWLSVVWGKMIVEGRNPYYQLFTLADVGGLPLDHYPTLMTYGPLWALLAAGLSAVSLGYDWLNFVALKLALGGLWLLSLALILRIHAGAPARHRALAVVLFGWLPASVQLTIGEAHNDIAMVCALLLWLLLVAREQHGIAPFALAASILTKYTTAPLIAVEVADAWLRKGIRRMAYAVSLLLTVGLSAIVFRVFWEGPGFFTRVIAENQGYWAFYTPTHALSSLAGVLHVPLPWSVASALTRILFGGIVLLCVVRYARRRGFPELSQLVLAIMVAVLFAGAGHIYPWFFLWVLAPGAVAIRSKLLLLIVPVGALAPFANLYWLIAPGPEEFHYGSIAFYAVLVPAVILVWWNGWLSWDSAAPALASETATGQ